jgi:hypothetical protein
MLPRYANNRKTETERKDVGGSLKACPEPVEGPAGLGDGGRKDQARRAKENSPPIDRWGTVGGKERSPGRDERASQERPRHNAGFLSPLRGLRRLRTFVPTVETVGYAHPSLRDYPGKCAEQRGVLLVLRTRPAVVDAVEEVDLCHGHCPYILSNLCYPASQLSATILIIPIRQWLERPGAMSTLAWTCFSVGVL